MEMLDRDLLSIQEARILIEKAKKAQEKLKTFPQEILDKFSLSLIECIEKNLEGIVEKYLEENPCGNKTDKLIRNKYLLSKLKEMVKTQRCVGILQEDKEKKTCEIGVPLGVVVAFSKNYNSLESIIYNLIVAIKTGNSIVFSIDLKGKEILEDVINKLTQLGQEVGIPKDTFGYLKNYSVCGEKELINHRYTTLIINNGCEKLIDIVKQSGKKYIYGTQGNGPVFIERSADVEKAVEDIIFSKTFDNGTLPGAEQEIIIDGPIKDTVENILKEKGCYFLNEEQSEKLKNILFDEKGKFNGEFIGKTPQFIGELIGVHLGENIKIIVIPEKFVDHDRTYEKEILSPIIPVCVEDDWKEACERCIELLLGEKVGHTMVIHSQDEEVIKEFALKKPVGRILVNTSGVLGTMGGTTNLFPSTIISFDNISPKDFIYIRKVAFETIDKEEFLKGLGYNKDKEKLKGKELLFEFIRELLKKVNTEVKE